MERDLFISRDAIRNRVKDMAARISADYDGLEPILIGILNGVFIFLADLIREITIPVKLDFVRAASYGSKMSSSGTITQRVPTIFPPLSWNSLSS